jgi:hypothetical protein
MKVISFIYTTFKISILSVLIVLAIGQFQLIYKIRYFDNLIDINLGIPFDFFFFTKGCEFELQGFKLLNFIGDFLIVLFIILISRFFVKILNNKLSKNKTK